MNIGKLLKYISYIVGIVAGIFAIDQATSSQNETSFETGIEQKTKANNDDRSEPLPVKAPETITVKSEGSSTQSTRESSPTYISNSTTNNPERIEIAVSILNESSNLDDELINGVSEFYSDNGFESKYNIFNKGFYNNGIFNSLFAGQLDYVNTLNLDSYCDKLVIGKMSCNYTSNTMDPSMTVANTILYLKVISTTTSTIEKSLSIIGKNTGWSKEEARENSINEILSQLPNKL